MIVLYPYWNELHTLFYNPTYSTNLESLKFKILQTAQLRHIFPLCMLIHV